MSEVSRRLRRAISPFSQEPDLKDAIQQLRNALTTAETSLKSVRPSTPSNETAAPDAVYFAIERDFATSTTTSERNKLALQSSSLQRAALTQQDLPKGNDLVLPLGRMLNKLKKLTTPVRESHCASAHNVYYVKFHRHPGWGPHRSPPVSVSALLPTSLSIKKRGALTSTGVCDRVVSGAHSHKARTRSRLSRHRPATWFAV